MPDSDVLAHAAKFIGGTEDATDLMQDVEDYLKGEIPCAAGKPALKAWQAEVDRLTPLVTDVISTALQECSALLALKAQRQMEQRRIQEMRVQAVIDQFNLARLVQDGIDTSVDISALTDALYGINGVQR